MYPVYERLRYLYVRPSRSRNGTSTVKSGERARNACSRTQDSTRIFDGSFCPGACLPLPSRSKHTTYYRLRKSAVTKKRNEKKVDLSVPESLPYGSLLRVSRGLYGTL